MKPVLLRPKALEDLESLIRGHTVASGQRFGEQVMTLALEALSSIGPSPGAGARFLGHLCKVPELRTCRTRHLALLWLYLETDDRIDVVRLLAERPDIPRLMHWAG